MHECKEKRTRTRPWATRCRIGREKRAVPDEDGRRHARGRADDDDDDDNDDDDDDDDDGARSGFDAIDLMVSFLTNPKLPLFFFFFFERKNLVKRKGVRTHTYVTTDMETRDECLYAFVNSLYFHSFTRYLLIVAYKYVCVCARAP